MDGDQADGALGLERAEPLGDARGRETIAAPARRHLDRDQVAVARVRAGAGGNRELATELLLVDRLEPSAAARRSRGKCRARVACRGR